MKILLISDTHAQHKGLTKKKWLPEADMIICSGDISSMGRVQEVQEFMEWYGNLDQYKYKIMICGNHDFLFERQPDIAQGLVTDNVHYLESSGVEIEGIKFYGEPRQPWFHSWAFNVNRGDLKQYWDKVPEDTDVLITHGPPKGYEYLGMTLEGDEVGDEELTTRIEELKNLRLNVCGHIHEGNGIFINTNGTTIINASVLDRHYNLVNKPYLIEIDENKKITILSK